METTNDYCTGNRNHRKCVKNLAENLEEVGEYQLKVNRSAYKIIIKEGYDDSCGARQLNRTIEKLIEDPIATAILKGEINEGDTIDIKGTKEGKLLITGNDKEKKV